jgi:hypothetical protein
VQGTKGDEMKVTVRTMDHSKEISFEFTDCSGVSDKQANYGTSCKSKAFERLASFLVEANSDKADAFLSKYAPQLAIIKADTDAKKWIEGSGDIREMIKALLG